MSRDSDSVLTLFKPVGATPLECIEVFRATHPAYNDVKLGYAGRLDPMADGLLLVLVGDENRNRESYLNLDKEYEVSILFGVSTDTYDVLGLPVEWVKYDVEAAVRAGADALTHFQGAIHQEYPPYSSQTVHGKPLYRWAREGKLDQIEIPSATRHVHSIKLLSSDTLSSLSVRDTISHMISLVTSGDFRVPDIRAGWDTFFQQSSQDRFGSISIRVRCSSGTYMRSLAHQLGKRIGIPALAWSIARTRIGDFALPPAG